MIAEVHQVVERDAKKKDALIQAVDITLNAISPDERSPLEVAFWFARKHVPMMVRSKSGQIVIRFWNEI